MPTSERKKNLFTDIFHMFQIAKCHSFESCLTLMVNKHELVWEFTFIYKVDTLKNPPFPPVARKNLGDGGGLLLMVSWAKKRRRKEEQIEERTDIHHTGKCILTDFS